MNGTPDARVPAHVVLVPGFWLGAWAWDDVVAHLTAHGVTALAVTLPGLEPDHPDRGSVGLEDHVAMIEQALARAPRGARTVLVAHSGAAVPATVALDRHVDEVDHVVWVDTAPVVDGYAIDPDVAGSEYPLSAQYDEELEQGSMEGLSEEQLATFRQRAVPQPASSLRESVSLRDERRLDVPGTIVCTAFPAAEYLSYAEQGMPFLAGVLQQPATAARRPADGPLADVEPAGRAGRHHRPSSSDWGLSPRDRCVRDAVTTRVERTFRATGPARARPDHAGSARSAGGLRVLGVVRVPARRGQLA